MSFGTYAFDFGVDGRPARGAGEAQRQVCVARVVVGVGASGVEVRVPVGVEEVGKGFYLGDVGAFGRAEHGGTEDYFGAGGCHCLVGS